MDCVRIGIVGLGVMGTGHMKSVQATPGAKLAAVCDIRPDVVEKVAKENNVKGFCDADEMFKSGEIDAVIIVTPHYDHPVKAVAAFEAGIHVMTDKPIAVHKADAFKMIDAHKKRPDLKFGAMFNMRTDSLFLKLHELIQSGEFGKIKRVTWLATNWLRTQAYYNAGGWRATWKGEGGGVLLNQCPHQLDLFQWYFGMPQKIRAFCKFGKYHKIEVEDDVTAYMEYDDGMTAVFMTSTGEAPGTNRIEISCDRGRVIVEDNKIIFKRTVCAIQEFIDTCPQMFNSPDIWNIDVPHKAEVASHQKMIANFVDSILKGTELIAPAEEGINSVELANAMLYSSINDSTVELPLDPVAYENLLADLIKNSKFVKPEEKKIDVGNFTGSFGKK